MYCSVVICVLTLALRWGESIVAREILCFQQCSTLLDCCKSSANGYEQCRRQIRVHEDIFLSSDPKFGSQIVIKKETQSVLRKARPVISFASITATFCVLRETLSVMQVSVWLFVF